MKNITNIIIYFLFDRRILIVFLIKCNFEQEDKQTIENYEIYNEYLRIFYVLSKNIDSFHDKMQF